MRSFSKLFAEEKNVAAQAHPPTNQAQTCIFQFQFLVLDKTRNCCEFGKHSFDLHIQIKFLAIRQQKFIWSLKEELSGVRPKAVVMSK